jgi:pimeloyl-ACP methyl ester carboxylesterase
VVYLDLRGHGRSEWGDPAAWSFEVCADDVRAFCDTLGIAGPVVYGHSLGGFVAMVYGEGGGLAVSVPGDSAATQGDRARAGDHITESGVGALEPAAIYARRSDGLP